jgi:hypothetical protein
MIGTGEIVTAMARGRMLPMTSFTGAPLQRELPGYSQSRLQIAPVGLTITGRVSRAPHGEDRAGLSAGSFIWHRAYSRASIACASRSRST